MTDDEAADIKRCLDLLYSTVEGTVPLARDFGLRKDVLDLPLETAKSLMAADIISKTAKFEPRVTVTGITWETDNTGQLKAKVAIKRV